MKQILRITKITLMVGIIMLMVTPQAKAQHFSPFLGDNYAGISGVYNNPASIANSRYIVDITLVGISTAGNQDYFGVRRNLMFNQLNFNAKERAIWNSRLSNKPWLHTDENSGDIFMTRPENSDKRYTGLVQNEIQVFNFMVACGPKFSFGITERVRTLANFDNASWGLMESMFTEAPQHTLGQINNGELRIAGATWNELGISLASQVWDGGKHYFKFGASFKIWQGLSSAYMVSDDMTYQFNEDGTVNVEGNYMWGVSEGPNDAIKQVRENQANGDYSSEDGTIFASNRNLAYLDAVVNNFFSNPFDGKYWKNLGFGLDLGFVYEWRPDYDDYVYDLDGKTGLLRKDQNKYRLKVSVAVVDINLNGGIKFVRDKNLATNMATTNNNSSLFGVSFFDNVVKSTEDMNATVANTFGNDPNSTLNEVGNDTIYSMKISPALTFGVDFYLGANFYANLGGYVPFSTFNGHKVTEFENENYNVVNIHSTASFNLTPRYERKWFGFAIPITYQLVNKNSVDVGVGFRFGPVWIGSNTIVSNSLSKYWEGIDVCAAVKIPIMYCAPKDKDGDGVSDRRDECKYLPGTWETRGCPDTDGDGIVDSEDECPYNAGLPEFNGCPDRDGDGIPDHLDDCPDTPGLAEFNGCPDTDGDGIPDHLDACPEEAGTNEYKGCPESHFIIDTDGDGIPDNIDECPHLPGTIEYNGCPEDALVFELEVVDNFDVNKSTLKPAAKEMLDKVVSISKANKARTIYIVGHADKTGNDGINDPLSLNRAKSVKKYLVDNGLNAKIISLDYEGSRDPVAPNNTREGRAKNRRVDIEIFFIDKK